MPTVPTTFAPQTQPDAGDLGRVQATPVQPMQNFAPQEIERFGSAMTRAGMAGVSYADMVNDQIDQAAARGADTAFMQSAAGILHGQDGYLNTQGAMAADGFAGAGSRLTEAARESLARLTPSQKALAQTSIARNLSAAMTQAGDHRAKQARVYEMGEASARAGQYADAAIRSSGRDWFEFEADRQSAINEARRAGRLDGLLDGSAQMQALEQAVNLRITTGVATGLADQRRYAEAIQYVEEAKGDGDVDALRADAILGQLRGSREQQVVRELTQSILGRGTLNAPSHSDNYGPVVESPLALEADGDVAYGQVLEGADILAMASGEVVAVDGGGRDALASITIRTPSGRTIEMGSVASQLKVGDRVVRGQVIGMAAELTQDPFDGYMVGSFNYRVREADGTAVNPSAINAVPGYMGAAVEPQSLGEALRLAGKAKLPDDQMELLRRSVTAEWSRRKSAEDADYAQVLDRMTQYVAAGNDPGTVPPSEWARLKPTDRAQLTAPYDAAARDASDTEVQTYIMSHPEALTVDWVRENAGAMKRETYLRLYKTASDPTALDSFSYSEGMVNIALDDAGQIRGVEGLTDSDKAKVVRFRHAVDERIRLDQRMIGRNLNQGEITALVTRMSMDPRSVMTPKERQAEVDAAYKEIQSTLSEDEFAMLLDAANRSASRTGATVTKQAIVDIYRAAHR